MLTTKDDDHFSPRGAPISDDELSVDSSVGRPHSESEGDASVSPLPAPAPNMASEGVTPLNTSTIGDNNQEGDATPRKCQPYQKKQRNKDVWERGSNNKLKQVQLNKLNWELYALDFGS